MFNFVRPLLPFIVCITLFYIMTMFWLYLNEQRETFFQGEVTKRSEKIAVLINADLNNRLPALKRVARRWVDKSELSKHRFELDTSAHIRDLPGFQAIEWVDENFVVRWIVPFLGNEPAQDLDLAFEANRRAALNIAKSNTLPTMTRPVELVQGGKGFLIYFPIQRESEFLGFILAVFKIDNWLEFILSDTESINTNPLFQTQVLIDGEVIYSSKEPIDSDLSKWEINSQIDILDRTIDVKVQPSRQFFESNWSSAPEIILIAGYLISILITIMVELILRYRKALESSFSANTHLEKNIQIRRDAENAAIQANKAKSDFLSAMSHELRTPLNAIQGFSQIIALDSKEVETKYHIEEVLKASRHLIELIDEVLDLAKIESGNLKINSIPINLEPIVKDCFATVAPLANEREISLVAEPFKLNKMVFADSLRLKQVLLNLLTNAIKYNKRKGKVKVRYELDASGQLVLTVEDTGIGLSISQQKKLFTPFERVGVEQSKVKGTGLGLVISKDLIELMGGRIGVSSQEGYGSRFWIALPLSD